MNKIHRSTNNKMVSGVCSGLGEYLNIDPTIVRIAYVFIALNYFGTALITYIICSIVIPEDDGVVYDEDYYERNEKFRKNTPIFIGGGLIIWGSFLLTKRLFPWFHLRFYELGRFWPVLLILLGIYVLFSQRD